MLAGEKHIDIVSEVAWLPAPAIEWNEEKSAFDVLLQPANCMQRGGPFLTQGLGIIYTYVHI